MIIQNKQFLTEADIIDFIAAAEAEFDIQVDKTVEKLTAGGDVKIVTLAGPSCSGKTTTAKKMIHKLNLLGKRISIISIDDFFKDTDAAAREKLKDTGAEVDYDTVKAIDLEYLAECMENIYEEKPFYLPAYDFITGRRSRYTLFTPSDYDFIVFEGIQAIYPEVTGLLAEHGHKRLYIDVADDIIVNGEYFGKREIRLIRRLVRDYKFRSSSPEFTLFLWKNVTENEDNNILPFRHLADVSINSLLPYEVNIIKQPLLDVLAHVSPDSRYYDSCMALAGKFRDIPAISARYVPDDSIYKEFLG